jgi:hypothetical protein
MVGECSSCRLATPRLSPSALIRKGPTQRSHLCDCAGLGLCSRVVEQGSTLSKSLRMICVDFGGGDACDRQSATWQGERAHRRSAIRSATHDADRRFCRPRRDQWLAYASIGDQSQSSDCGESCPVAKPPRHVRSLVPTCSAPMKI